MYKTVQVFIALLVISIMVGSFFIAGCTKHPNEKQLQALEETRSAALAAEAKSTTCEGEKNSLQNQLNQKKQQLESMQQEKIAVNNRLQSM